MEEIIVLKTCECGCNKFTTILCGKPKRFIYCHHLKTELNGFKGKHHSKEIIERIKKSHIESGANKRCSERMKKDNPMNYPESRKKVSKANKGKTLSEKTKRKISEGHKGRKNSEEHNRNIGEAKKRLYKDRTKNPNWQGGVSFLPYAPSFNNELKTQIRDRDNHVCRLCKTIENGRTLHVHHIDYDKMNNDPKNLITLCMDCHNGLQGDRETCKEVFSDFEIEELV